jgi:hypothetical protein
MLMSRDIHVFLLRMSAIVGIVSITAGLKLESLFPAVTGVPRLLAVVLLSVLLGTVVPDWISWALSRWRWYRRLVMGETWIEGAWLLETSRSVESNKFDVQRRRFGIVAYTYHGSYLSLRTEGHHLEFTDITGKSAPPPDTRVYEISGRLWAESSTILASSRLAFIDESLTYINVFKYDAGSSGEGTASGWFKSGEGRSWPEEFTATIATKEGEVLYQRGRKLDDSLVLTLKEKYPGDWEEVLIRHRFLNGNSWKANLQRIVAHTQSEPA